MKYLDLSTINYQEFSTFGIKNRKSSFEEDSLNLREGDDE